MAKPLAPTINWNNPLARNLVNDTILFERGGAVTKDGATNIIQPFTAAPSWKNTLIGTGLVLNGSSQYMTLTTMPGFVGNLANSGFTYAALFITSSASLMSLQGTFDTGNTFAFDPSLNRDSGGGTTSNFLGFFFRDNNNNFVNFGSTNAVSFQDSAIHLAVWTGNVRAIVYQVYFDGKAVPTSQTVSGTIATFTTSGFTFVAGARNVRGSITQFFNGTLLYSRLWSRVFTPTEVKSLYTNPFQIYTNPLQSSLNTGIFR